MENLKLGDIVEVKDKNVTGKGKNDGSVQGKEYFSCPDKHGMFVRPTQVKQINKGRKHGSKENSPSKTPSRGPSRGPSRENSSLSQRQKSDLARQRSDLSKSARKESGGALGGANRSPKETMPGSKGGADGGSMQTVAEGSDEPMATPLGSKIAQPRSRLPLPGGGRQPSFTNISRKSDAATPIPEKQPFQRERSFVETNFVQTPRTTNVTQIVAEKVIATPGTKSSASSSATASPSLSSVMLSDKMEEKVQNLQLQQEIHNYKDEIKDLQEKLDTLKIKRAQDKEKMKDYEKIVLQNEQLIEFKTRIMESQSALQKDLQKAKHEAREAIEARERHAEEMQDLSETVEMATLDKEMAEEKAEALQLELEATKERIEELTLDLEIIKAEMGEDGKMRSDSGEVGSGVTNFELKTLQAQNEKLRETLVSMRDLSAHEKHEIQKLTKDLEEKVAELAKRTKDNEKLCAQVEEMEQTISDLQEQVDAALGAEEMVENLTTKCLDLEDRVAAILEEKMDLEALHDINEEMQENAREIELELREELDMSSAKVRELQRDKETMQELVADHETTIHKFRGFVAQIQDQNRQLKEALEKETSKPLSGSMGVSHEMLDFKKMFAETKAHAKAIDVELRKLEIQEAGQHIKYLMAYMGDTFLARGGDYEAIQVLLLIPRLLCKSDILQTQVKEQFTLPENIDRNSVLKDHGVDRYGFGSRLLHLLVSLDRTLHQFSHALNTCSVENILKGLDFYIDLLRRGQLDENVPVSNLEKTLNYFDTIFPMYLNEMKTNCSVFLADHVKIYMAAIENLRLEIRRARAILDPSSEGSEVGVLFKTLENQLKDLEAQVKIIKRRLPQDRSQGPLNFPESVAVTVNTCANNLWAVIKVMDAFGKSAMALAIATPETGVPGPKLHDTLLTAVDTKTEFGDQGIQFTMKNVANTLTRLSVISTAIQNGEYDFDGTKDDTPAVPILLRAEQVKAEVKDATGIKYKLEAKDSEIKDFRKILKAKQDELSEMQVRKDLLEKKLIDSNRDHDLIVEKLQRKLDDSQNLMKRKEKEFEETMDHLQADIDSLENERGELKDKMKQMSKKALLQGLSKESKIITAEGGPTSLGPSVPSPVRDSPLLVQQVSDMRAALNSLQQSKARIQGNHLRERLAKLKPIHIPKSQINTGKSEQEKSDVSKDQQKELGDELSQLIRRCGAARSELYSLLCSQQIVDVTNPTGNLARKDAKEQKARQIREKALRSEIALLQLEMTKLLAARMDNSTTVNSSFGSFASTGASKAINEKEYSLMGQVSVLGQEDMSSEPTKSVPLIINIQQLKQIHASFLH